MKTLKLSIVALFITSLSFAQAVEAKKVAPKAPNTVATPAQTKASAMKWNTETHEFGEIEKGKKVMVIEDLISTGKSSIGAIRALKSYGLNVVGMIAIFTYEFSVSEDNFNKEEINVKTLSNYSTLLRIAQKTQYISEIECKMLEKWNGSPSTWS